MYNENENELKSKLRTLRHIALEIEKETDQQKNELSKTEFDIGRTMMLVNRSLSRIMSITKNRFSHVFYMFVFGILFFLLIFYFFM